jgi:hypothetical protein
MRRAAYELLSLAALLAISASARAEPIESRDPSLEAVALRVEGFPGCPSSEDFWRRLQQRAPGIRLTRAGEPGRVFVVRFQEQEKGRAMGRLRILDVEGNALEREVTGVTCVEVADALALVGAVAARFDVSSDVQPAMGAAQEPPRRTARPPTSEQAATPVNDDRAPHWNVLVRGQFSVRAQILPALLYGAGGGFEVSRDGSSSWQPTLGAAVEATLTATANTDHVVPETEMTAQLAVVHLFASPLRLRAGAVELRPYLSFDIGRLALEGRGNGLARDTQNRKLWIAVALLAQASVQLGGGWALGARAGAEARPFLYQFTYTDRDVYQVGDVGLVVGASVSYRFE